MIAKFAELALVAVALLLVTTGIGISEDIEHVEGRQLRTIFDTYPNDTHHPSYSPTMQPTRSPDESPPSPTVSPTNRPSHSPTNRIILGTWGPKISPTVAPTAQPTQPTSSPTFKKKSNVLVIISDDLKPLLSTYSLPYSDNTPNINLIAQRGITFMNAHSQISLCGPSRASFLTSLRPDKLGFFNLKANILETTIRNTQTNKLRIETFPQWFKENGYATYGAGKIFHENEYILYNSPDHWTEPVYTWMEGMSRPPSFKRPYEGTWTAFPEVEDEFYPDGQLADLASNLIKDTLSSLDQPWLFMVGFWKPHLPFQCPNKYLTNETAPTAGNPWIQNFNSDWMGIVKGGVCNEPKRYDGYSASTGLSHNSGLALQRQATRGYRATVNYLDAQVGKILDALNSTGAIHDTHIVFFGDHGFHLGDKGLYCKHTNFEQGVRVPLIIAPALRENSHWAAHRGKKSFAPVELLDVFPTMVDLVGIPKKYDADMYGQQYLWQGVSLRPILEDPENGYVKTFALAQYPRGSGSSRKMGYTFRTTRYRLTVWCSTPFSYSNKCYHEVYDFLTDPGETTNQAPVNPTLRTTLLAEAHLPGKKNYDLINGNPPFDFADRIALRNLPGQPFP